MPQTHVDILVGVGAEVATAEAGSRMEECGPSANLPGSVPLHTSMKLSNTEDLAVHVEVDTDHSDHSGQSDNPTTSEHQADQVPELSSTCNLELREEPDHYPSPATNPPVAVGQGAPSLGLGWWRDLSDFLERTTVAAIFSQQGRRGLRRSLAIDNDGKVDILMSAALCPGASNG